METGDLFLIIVSLCVVITIMIIFMAMSIRWIMFGLNIMFKRFSKKGNIGLLFIKSKSNNFGIPHVVDLGKKDYEFSISGTKHLYPIHREAFGKQGLFFGLPYAMYNDDDCKTSLGLMYHAATDKGEPLYHDDLQTMPVYTPIKNSVSLGGNFLKALVDEKVFSDALKDFLNKNQVLLFICIGSIAAAGISAYFGYEIMSNTLPNIESLIINGFQGISNKLDLILEAVK